MGFTRPRFAATVLLPGYQITGQIEPIGPWLDWLNARDKYTLPVQAARVYPLDGAPVATTERAVVHLNRADVRLIHLPERAAGDSVHMLRNAQAAILHLGPVICRGDLHMGADATLATFMDDLPGAFFPVTNAQLFTTTTLPVPLPRQADLILVNRAQVQVYYPA